MREIIKACTHLNDMLGLLQDILARNRPLASVQTRCHPLRRIHRIQIWRRLKQSLQRTIAIERQRIEQQMARLEWEQERTHGRDLLQPLRQIAGHDDQRILQLAAGLGGDLRVNELRLWHDVLVSHTVVQRRPVSIQNVDNAQHAQRVE